MLQRILLATGIVAALAATTLVAPAAAAPVTQQCSSTGGVKVSADQSPATISVYDTTTDAPVDVVVTITGSAFTITAPNAASYTLDDASWCLKSSIKTAPATGTGTSGTSGAVNKKGVAQNIGYLMVYDVTTEATTVSCYEGINETDPDFRLVGAIGTVNNAVFSMIFDGSCDPLYDFLAGTVVSAADRTAADMACTNLGAGLSISDWPLSDQWQDAQTDWWLCVDLYYVG